MSKLQNILSNGYNNYLISKIGEERATKAFSFCRYPYFEEACSAAFNLKDAYDCGIALATDGLWLGYIFELFSAFPVTAVKMNRRGVGATWLPIDEVDVINKKIIVFDNDVVTGRTLKRAAKELSGANQIDLLLVYGHTEVAPESYEKWKHFLSDEHKFLGWHWGNICIDTMCQVPDSFNKVLTIESDVSNSKKAIDFLESKLIKGESR